jgi:hypothetical protein
MNKKTRMMISGVIVLFMAATALGYVTFGGQTFGYIPCVDSDNGDIYKLGHTTNPNTGSVLATDECDGTAHVYEAVCSLVNNPQCPNSCPKVTYAQQLRLDCPNGCVNGACTGAPPATTTTSTMPTVPTTLIPEVCVGEDCAPGDETGKIIVLALGAGCLIILKPWRP